MLKLCEVSRNLFSNRFWKFQLFILKNQKVLFQKKYIYISALFSKHTKIIPKDGASRLNFPEGFDYNEEALHLASKETVRVKLLNTGTLVHSLDVFAFS